MSASKLKQPTVRKPTHVIVDNPAPRPSSSKPSNSTRSARIKLAPPRPFELAYVNSLYDPAKHRGAGIPDEFTIPSQKLQTTSVFTFTAGGTVDNAVGFVALNPHFLCMNDSNSIQCTNSAYNALTITGDGSATGVSYKQANSPYTVSDFARSGTSSNVSTNRTATRRFRLVSCKLTVTAQPSLTAKCGQMVGLVTPLHEPLVGMTFDDINTFDGAARIAGNYGSTVEVCYTPVWPSEMTYHSVMDLASMGGTMDYSKIGFDLDCSALATLREATYTQYGYARKSVQDHSSPREPFMGVMIDGGDENAYSVQIVSNFELIGFNLGQLASPSLHVPRAMSVAKQLAGVVSSASASKSNQPSFFDKLLKKLPDVVDVVENGLENGPSGFLQSGFDLIKGLF